MFAVCTPANDVAGDSVVVVVANLVIDGMTEIPRLNDVDESLLLSGDGTVVSRMDTRSRDEVRDRL